MTWSLAGSTLAFTLVFLAISGCTLGILVARRRFGVGLLWLWIGALTTLFWISFGALWFIRSPSLGGGEGQRLFLGSGVVAPSLLMLLLLVYLEHGVRDAWRVLLGSAAAGLLFQLFHELAAVEGSSLVRAPGWLPTVAAPVSLVLASAVMVVTIQALRALRFPLWLRCFLALMLGVGADAFLFPVFSFGGLEVFRRLQSPTDFVFSKVLSALILTLPVVLYLVRQSRIGRRLAMQDLGPLAIAGLGTEGPVPDFAMWRAMAETLGDGMTGAADGHLVFANAAMARIAGFDGVEAMTGLPLATIIHPDDQARVLEDHWSRLEGATTSTTLEWRLRRPSGEVRLIATTATTALLGAGRVAIGIHRDVTEERRTRHELEHSNRAVRALMAGASSLVASIRTDTLVARLAEQACSLVGAEFVVYFERVGDQLVCRYREGPSYGVLEGEVLTREQALTFGLLPRSGPRHAVALVAGGEEQGLLVVALREEDRRFTEDELALLDALGAMGAAALNTTRLVQQLTDAEARYATLFDQVPAAVWLYDLDTLRIEAVNQAAIRRYGYDREAFLALTLPELATPDSRESAAAAARRIGAYAAPSMLLQHQDREGASFDVLVNASEVEIAGVSYGLAAAVDLTLERRNQERKEISQRLESLGRLAGGIAHDFNNILTALQVDLDLMIADHGANRALQSDLAHVRVAVGRAADLTRQILLFSRGEESKRKPVSVNDSIRAIERLLTRSLGEMAELVIVLTPENPQISADTAQLQLALVNLCLNARDAMPRGGQLRIKTERRLLDAVAAGRLGMVPGPAALLIVEDNGTGMSPEIRARALEPFFTTKQAERGTGLGLSIVHGVVTSHDGAVELESEPGIGTRVVLYFPELAGAPAEPEAAPVGDLRGNERILLVDDEPGIRRTGKRLLERHGYRVIVAENGEEAVQRLEVEGHTVQLVVTDMVMPRMDALGLVKVVRARWPALPVILSTGYDDGRLAEGDVERFQAVIAKPYTAQEMLGSIRAVLDRGRPAIADR